MCIKLAVSDENVQKNIKAMEKGLKQLETDVKNYSKKAPEGDRFPEAMNISLNNFNVLLTLMYFKSIAFTNLSERVKIKPNHVIAAL